MITRREQVLEALRSTLATQGWFPPVLLDAPEPEDMRTLAGDWAGLSDAVSVQDGELDTTREALGAGDTYELRLTAYVVYRVDGVDQAARRRRRDAAQALIVDAIAADPSLTLNEVCAQIGGAERDDDMPGEGMAGSAALSVPVLIDFTAASAAG